MERKELSNYAIRNGKSKTGNIGGLGFEPRLAESESAVLPLDDPPSEGAASYPRFFDRSTRNERLLVGLKGEAGSFVPGKLFGPDLTAQHLRGGSSGRGGPGDDLGHLH